MSIEIFDIAVTGFYEISKLRLLCSMVSELSDYNLHNNRHYNGVYNKEVVKGVAFSGMLIVVGLIDQVVFVLFQAVAHTARAVIVVGVGRFSSMVQQGVKTALTHYTMAYVSNLVITSMAIGICFFAALRLSNQEDSFINSQVY